MYAFIICEEIFRYFLIYGLLAKIMHIPSYANLFINLFKDYVSTLATECFE